MLFKVNFILHLPIKAIKQIELCGLTAFRKEGLMLQDGKCLKNRIHALLRQLARGHPLAAAFKERRYLEDIFHQRFLRFIENPPPNDAAVNSFYQMNFEKHGCRMLCEIAVTFSFGITVDIAHD